MKQPQTSQLQDQLRDIHHRLDRLSRPAADVPLWALLGSASTSATSLTALAVSAMYRRGATIGVTLYVDVTGTGTGSARLRLSSPATNGVTVAIPNGTGQLVDVTLAVPDGWAYGVKVAVFLDVAVSAGTATITPRVVDAWQR
jgi:hypothetical protein